MHLHCSFSGYYVSLKFVKQHLVNIFSYFSLQLFNFLEPKWSKE